MTPAAAVDTSARPRPRPGAGAPALGLLLALLLPLLACTAEAPWQIRCRHEDDPTGQRDFRVLSRGGAITIRYSTGLERPGERTATGVRFLEREGQPGHPSDNDADDQAALLDGQTDGGRGDAGHATRLPGVGVNFDRQHDVVHGVVLDLERLRFVESEELPDGRPGRRMGGGVCRPLAAS